MTKQKPWRLIIKVRESYHKICSFWGFKKDATLFLKIYSNDNGRMYDVKNIDEQIIEKSEQRTVIEQKISYSEVVPINFFANKQSFHPSGYTHVTDNNGNRLKDGIKTFEFETVDKYKQLALIFPKNPESYPQIYPESFRKEDVFIDFNRLHHSPFQIELFIINGNNNPRIYPSGNPKNVSQIDIFCGEHEKYLLFIRCSQVKDMIGKKFPPYTFIASFAVGAKKPQKSTRPEASNRFDFIKHINLMLLTSPLYL